MGRHADITLHIDEELDSNRSAQMCSTLEGVEGVQRVRCAENKPHLFVVEFDPDRIDGSSILGHVHRQGLHGELIGL